MGRLPSEERCRYRGSFTEGASFNYSLIRSLGSPGGAAALRQRWAIGCEPRVASQTVFGPPPPTPRGSPFHVNRISICRAHSKDIYAHLVCQSCTNKPVYVLNTVGTLDIPDTRCHRQVIKSTATLRCFLVCRQGYHKLTQVLDYSHFF